MGGEISFLIPPTFSYELIKSKYTITSSDPRSTHLILAVLHFFPYIQDTYKQVSDCISRLFSVKRKLNGTGLYFLPSISFHLVIRSRKSNQTRTGSPMEPLENTEFIRAV